MTREAIDPQQLSQLNLPSAAQIFQREQEIFLQKRTRKDYEQYFAKLIEFLGDRLTLSEFTIGNVRAYQRWRSETAGPRRTNQEVRAFSRLMKAAGMWKRIEQHYKPLPLPHEGPGRALTHEEAKHLFRSAATNKRWMVAFYAGLLSAHAGAGPGEIRHLQLGDIDMENRELTIRRGVKNRFRVRKVELSDTAFLAVRRLLDRARKRGSTQPEHFLLPALRKGGGGFDPTRPQDNWRKAWDGMRKAAGFNTLRPYDLRHTFATWLFGNRNVSLEVAAEMMGWSPANPQMVRLYSHQRSEVKRKAAEAVDQMDLFGPEKKKPEPANMLEGIDVRTKVQ